MTDLDDMTENYDADIAAMVVLIAFIVMALVALSLLDMT